MSSLALTTSNSGLRECFMFSPEESYSANRESQPFSVYLDAFVLAAAVSVLICRDMILNG